MLFNQAGGVELPICVSAQLTLLLTKQIDGIQVLILISFKMMVRGTCLQSIFEF
jgi:hypothetical protein